MKWLLTVLMLGVVLEGRASEPQFRAYPVVSGGGVDILEGVQIVAGPDAKVTLAPSGKQIYVMADESGHSRVRQLLGASLPHEVRNIRVVVEFREKSSGTRGESGLDGSVEIERLAGHGRMKVRLRPRVENMMSGSDALTRQDLLLMNGSEGSIFVGEEVPFFDWLVEYAVGAGVLRAEQAVSRRKVGALLRVQVLLVGNGPMIRIRLTPELTYVANGRNERIRYTSVSTEVVGYHGQPLRIGGLLKHGEFYDRFLAGSRRSGGRSALEVTMTPWIVGPDGRPQGR